MNVTTNSYWGTQWMARLYWWFKNQDAKNARCSRWIAFGFFFTLIVSLKMKSGRKRCLYFTKKLKCYRYRNYRWFATLSQLLSMFHFHRRSIAALTSRFIDSSMYCHNLSLSELVFSGFLQLTGAFVAAQNNFRLLTTFQGLDFRIYQVGDRMKRKESGWLPVPQWRARSRENRVLFLHAVDGQRADKTKCNMF